MNTNEYDIIVVGASFAGLSFVRNLPPESDLKILVVDAKHQTGATVESTGLITEHTKELFKKFFDIDKYITNSITTIGVITTDFTDHFFSEQKSPWIYQTDTKKLVRALSSNLPENITVMPGTIYLGNANFNDKTNRMTVNLMRANKKFTVQTRFLVGADGGSSKVAAENSLARNKKFLFGIEEVYFGKIHLGPHPAATIYHFWFGEFSLGYGGWLSSTVIDDKPAFRIGLAKELYKNSDSAKLLKHFTAILLKKGIITIDGPVDRSYGVYGSKIPIGGPLKKIHCPGVLLIGDAAGFCGAFSADGIKGAVISGIEAAKLVNNHLSTSKPDHSAFKLFHPRMNTHHKVITYYKKQVFYRFIWDLMRTNRTFRQMFNIIKREKDGFLEQFCDSKEKAKGLTSIVLKPRHVPALCLYSLYLFLDLFKSRK